MFPSIATYQPSALLVGADHTANCQGDPSRGAKNAFHVRVKMFPVADGYVWLSRKDSKGAYATLGV